MTQNFIARVHAEEDELKKMLDELNNELAYHEGKIEQLKRRIQILRDATTVKQ